MPYYNLSPKEELFYLREGEEIIGKFLFKDGLTEITVGLFTSDTRTLSVYFAHKEEDPHRAHRTPCTKITSDIWDHSDWPHRDSVWWLFKQPR